VAPIQPARDRPGHGRRALAAALAILLGLAGALGHARAPEEVRRLAGAGAVDLAIDLINTEQRDLAPTEAAWQDWERERLEILRRRSDWHAIIGRAERWPEAGRAGFLRWARTQLARAHLETARPDAARAVLRALLWAPDGADASTARRAGWRRMVVRSYLIDGRLADARTALRRYRLDHDGSDPEVRRWQARVQLRDGDPDSALRTLDGMTDGRARVLRLSAELRAGTRAAGEIAADAAELARTADMGAVAKRWAWRLAAEAADRAGRPRLAIEAREAALAIEAGDAGGALFPAVETELWRAYLRWGAALGNDAGLVIGADRAWFERAARLGEDDPRQARALLAVVALRSPTAGAAAEAHERLIASFEIGESTAPVLRALYLESERPGAPAGLPPGARHHLARAMVATGDLEQAARLVADLETPPEGREPFDWGLRRARILVLAGRSEPAAEAVGKLLAQHPELDGGQRDRLLQVLFDFQATDEHERALMLFRQMLGRGVGEQQRREILFWIADSLKALDRPDEAAQHYLLSATLPGPKTMDPWAQTALFRAAEVLAANGRGADAARLYRDLLRATSDPTRRTMIENRLSRVEARRGGGDDASARSGSSRAGAD